MRTTFQGQANQAQNNNREIVFLIDLDRSFFSGHHSEHKNLAEKNAFHAFQKDM
jgi:hypothetical protein